ncbi:MAG: SIS domain-containing protein [Erysipelotrichaceae bacterium]|nr:SIS domain-containing protein [Erysipelotrichaceae bacterium]
MINFNKELMLENGQYIYNQRDYIEQIATAVCNEGFSNIFISSVGGSQAMMDPFYDMINEMSDIPVYKILSSVVIYTDHNQINKDSLILMASKSGDTKETLEAAKYFKDKGCRIISIIGANHSPLEQLSDYSVIYGDGRPQELILYLLIGKILHIKGYFDHYPKFALELKNLPAVLVKVREEFDDKAITFCQNYYQEPYSIWIASGMLWPVCYAYAMCVLEESQWIRTKSVSSPEFFHGTLELIEDDVCTVLLIGEGKTRDIDLRVKGFIEKYSHKVTIIDTADYTYPGISDEFRNLLSPVVMNALLQRISKNMEVINNHSLDIRRYYRKVDY